MIICELFQKAKEAIDSVADNNHLLKRTVNFGCFMIPVLLILPPLVFGALYLVGNMLPSPGKNYDPMRAEPTTDYAKKLQEKCGIRPSIECQADFNKLTYK